MRTLSKLSIIVLALLAVACGPSIRAPLMPDGSKVALHVYMDANSKRDDITSDRARQLEQVLNWMEPDFHEILRDAGYVVVPLKTPEGVAPAPGKYLVSVKFLRYDPGSAAARVMVGFGAGSATLDVHYELTGPSGEIFHDNIGVSSGRSWQAICRKLNKMMAKKISEILASEQ